MRKLWVLLLLCLLLNVVLFGDGFVEAKKKKSKGEKAAKSVAQADEDELIDAVLRRASESAAADEEEEGPAIDLAKVQEARAHKAKLKAKRAEKAAAKLAARLAEARKRNKKFAQLRAKRNRSERDARQKAQEKADKQAKQRLALDTPATRQKARERLDWLYSKAMRSNNYIMSFTSGQFQEYALTSPRPYYLFLSFTARSPNYRCPLCHQAYPEMAIVARAIGSKYNTSREVNLFGDESQFPLFFAEVDIGNCPDVFQALQLTSAPTIVLLPPAVADKPIKMNQFMSTLKMKYRFVPLSASIAAEDLIAFINKLRPGAQVHLERGINTQALIVYALLLTALGAAAYFIRDQLLLLRGIRMPFLVAGWIFYMFCFSGGMYNYIRETPWSGYDHQGREVYISTSGREQYAFEGYLMGACEALCALFLTLAIKVMSTDASDKGAGGKRGALSKVASFLNSTVAPPVLLALAGFLWFQVLVVYTRKNWHYRMGLLAGDAWLGWLD